MWVLFQASYTGSGSHQKFDQGFCGVRARDNDILKSFCQNVRALQAYCLLMDKF